MAALSVAFLAIPLWGQRGGHGGMGGGRGGYAGHGGGYAGHGGGYTGAPRGGAGWGGGFRGGFGHGPYGYPGHYPYYPGRYYPGRYPWGYRGYYGYGGYGYGGYGYPWAWGWYGGSWPDTYDSYPATQSPAYVYAYPDNSNTAVNYDQQQQIDRLNDEVARLRAEREPGSGATSAPQPPPKTQIRSATLLVFRDRHTEEIQDYAIVGKTLWVFTEQRARKIPIAELNVPATTKANEDRGIEFRLPGQ